MEFGKHPTPPLHVCSGLRDLNAINTYKTDKETYLTMAFKLSYING